MGKRNWNTQITGISSHYLCIFLFLFFFFLYRCSLRKETIQIESRLFFIVMIYFPPPPMRQDTGKYKPDLKALCLKTTHSFRGLVSIS